MKKENRIKAGDKVRLISTEQLPNEGVNWIFEEDKKVRIGQKFTVTWVNTIGTWITLKGLTYDHPVGKFEIIIKETTPMKMRITARPDRLRPNEFIDYEYCGMPIGFSWTINGKLFKSRDLQAFLTAHNLEKK